MSISHHLENENAFEEYIEYFDDDFTPLGSVAAQNSPHVLTGGETPNSSQTQALTISPPPPLISCIVDYLSVTFSIDAVCALWNYRKQVDMSQDAVALNFLEALRPLVSHLEWFDNDRGRFGYRRSITLTRGEEKQTAGVFAYDGNNGTALLSLTGFGCSGVSMFKMRRFLEKIPGARITRVDLAHDDLSPPESIHDWEAKAIRGEFQPERGRAPSTRFMNDHGSGAGCTLYVGNKSNGKEACIYEKGKQLGDTQSKWIRYEGRLTNVDRVVPWDVLTSPSAYLAGMYAPFSMLSAFHERIEIVKKQAGIAYDSMKAYCRIAYGKLIHVMRETGCSDSSIVEELINVEGIPRRLIMPFTS